MPRYLKVMPRLPVADLQRCDHVLPGRPGFQRRSALARTMSRVSFFSIGTTPVFSFTWPIDRRVRVSGKPRSPSK